MKQWVQSFCVPAVFFFFYYCFNFTGCYWSFQAFCFFCIQFWKIIFFWKFVHFTQVFKSFGIQLFVVISYNPLYFGGISSNLSFSFLILFIWVLSLFFLMSLVKGLLILPFQGTSSWTYQPCESFF